MASEQLKQQMVSQPMEAHPELLQYPQEAVPPLPRRARRVWGIDGSTNQPLPSARTGRTAQGQGGLDGPPRPWSGEIPRGVGVLVGAIGSR